jgi:hypothetical protein
MRSTKEDKADLCIFAAKAMQVHWSLKACGPRATSNQRLGLGNVSEKRIVHVSLSLWIGPNL